MLHGFDWDFGQFSVADYSTLDFLIKMHASDFSFYHTGSRFLKSDLVMNNTDYDFFIKRDGFISEIAIQRFLENLRHPSVCHYSFRELRFHRTNNNGGYYMGIRFRADTHPSIDVFVLEDAEFELYKAANDELKNDEKRAKEISKEERVRFYEEKTGIRTRARRGVRRGQLPGEGMRLHQWPVWDHPEEIF